VNSTTEVLSVAVGSNTYTQQLAGDYTGEYFHLAPGAYGGTQVTLNNTPCFGRGTRILTDRGEIAVEQLAIGDRGLTADGAAKRIVWIGRRHIDLLRHPLPEQVQPILISPDAVADGVPHRDLLLSPDHAVLFDGVLIPARRLVNGASIRRDAQCREVTYFHVELETHDILLAEALPAESYLDTGNRWTFENADTPLILHPDFENGQHKRVAESCRPLVDDVVRMERIWRRLAVRAQMLGLALPEEPNTSKDPELHVVMGGRVIKPVRRDAGCYTFVLPWADGPARLVSRTVRPCEVRPWVEDHRRLGVMVSRLTLKCGAHVEAIPLDHPHLLQGWWDVERDCATLGRWTNGSATIPLSGEGLLVLEIALAGSLDYPLDQDVEADTAPAARRIPTRSAVA
jgi:hypothetical protein